MIEARHLFWRWLAGFAITVVLLAWGLSQVGRFLEAPASAPSQADVLLALGGDTGDRALTVASLYAAGFAPRVVITGPEGNPARARKAILSWRTQVLVEEGVPPERILYDEESTNTWEEAVNMRRSMEARGWRRVLVVSDPYHLRWLSWTWRRVFEGSGLEYLLVASSPEFWKPDEWWRDEKSGAAVILEYIKIAYYLVKY